MLIRQVVVVGSALCLAALVLASLTSIQAAQAAPNILPLIVDRDDNAPGLPCTDGDLHDCTLRSAVQLDNAGASRDIQFSPGPHTINLTATLVLSGNNTFTVASPGQSVIVVGNGVGQVFQISGSFITIRGLRLYGAGSHASNIWIKDTAKSIVIANDVIGAPAATGPCPVNSSYSGIFLDSRGALTPSEVRAWISGNTIRCHAGSPGDGIDIEGTDHVLIGEDIFGNAGITQSNTIAENARHGVNIEPQQVFLLSYIAMSNTVRNSTIISNVGSGVFITSAARNVIMGNGIFSNTRGIELRGGSANNQVGCPLGGPRDLSTFNLVSGNAEEGIYIADPNTQSNTVYCNGIGVDLSGTTAVPNQMGVVIENGAFQNRVGNTSTERNLIAGNTQFGVAIIRNAHDNRVAANFIGTNAAGDGVLAAQQTGILLGSGANRNTIGGPLTLNGNLIGGNVIGVWIAGTDTATNTLQANSIGYNNVLGIPLPNAWYGVVIDLDAHDNVLTGTIAPTGNWIAHNGRSGVLLNNTVRNIVGPGKIFNNGHYGVLIDDAAGNRIERTEIFSNTLDGIADRRDWTTGRNSWTQVSIYNNGGLGIDKRAITDTTDSVDGPVPFITSVDPSTRLVSGKGLASNPPSGIFLQVELYRVAPDPSGFGEGKTYVGSALTDNAGSWAITDPLSTVGCYTAFQTLIFVGTIVESSEFGPHSCRTFLPLIQRSP